MRRAIWVHLPLTALLMLALPSFGQVKNSLPTMEEIKDNVGKREFRTALQQVARVMDLKGDLAAGYDKYDLYWIKGECQIQLKAQRDAADAFQAAFKVVDGSGPKAMMARGMEVLVRSSPGGNYMPKRPEDPKNPSAPRSPISILDGDGRKAAFNALLRDRLFEDEPKVKAAASGKSILPIIEAVNRVFDLASVETCATGKTAEASKMFLTLGTSAFKLMNDEIGKCRNEVNGIGAAALAGWRALNSNEMATLKHDEEYCMQIADAANLGAEVCKQLKTSDWAFGLLVKQAQGVASQAHTMRTATAPSATGRPPTVTPTRPGFGPRR